MNAVTQGAFAPKLAADRASILRDGFTAWYQRGGGKACPIAIYATTLAEALNAAKLSCLHKDVLFIREDRPLTREAVLHCWVIRQGKRIYVIDRETNAGSYAYPCKPDLLFSLPVTAFAPVEPWTYTPGCDVVGRDSGVIDALADKLGEGAP